MSASVVETSGLGAPSRITIPTPTWPSDTLREAVNLAVRYSRRDREARVLSQADAIVLVVRRGDGWKVQAVSTMGV